MLVIGNRSLESEWGVETQSGYFTLIREDTERDSRQEVLEKLARHFKLS